MYSYITIDNLTEKLIPDRTGTIPLLCRYCNETDSIMFSYRFRNRLFRHRVLALGALGCP